jgi:hypothetical protein
MRSFIKNIVVAGSVLTILTVLIIWVLTSFFMSHQGSADGLVDAITAALLGSYPPGITGVIVSGSTYTRELLFLLLRFSW